MLGALECAFREPALLPKDGDSLRASRFFKFNLLRKWLLILCFGKSSLTNSYTWWNEHNFLPKLHKFRPICVPFQVATTYVPSFKYHIVLTLMLKCFRKFQELSFTHVTFFFSVLEPQQYPFKPQFLFLHILRDPLIFNSSIHLYWSIMIFTSYIELNQNESCIMQVYPPQIIMSS